MNLYYFNPHDYDNTFSVMAKNEREALLNLKLYLSGLCDLPQCECDRSFNKQCYEYWKNAETDKLPEKYTIDCYKENEILKGEIC